VEASRPRFEPSRDQRDELARRFFAAAQGGDMDALLELLTADASFVGDGGGKAQAFPEPLAGRERIARVMVGLFRRGAALGAGMRPAEVNGMPGAVALDPEGKVINVFVLEIADGQVQTIRSVVNPDKLGHLGPVSDLARLPQSGGDTPPG
jgi:RNA polymerase sigma-70 factor (ECF subfamily)